MISPSKIEPDVELRDFLQGRITVGLVDGGTADVAVYGDWERPTNDLPNDFIVIYMNGDVQGVTTEASFARGYIAVSLYCKMNDDGSVKKNRVKKLLAQFDTIISGHLSDNFYFDYDTNRYITPTTPNQTSGYSITVLNLRWHTNNNYNTE